MSQWRATGASSARHAMRSHSRIGLLVAGVCLHAAAAGAQNPAFTVPRIITPAVGGLQPARRACAARSCRRGRRRWSPASSTRRWRWRQTRRGRRPTSRDVPPSVAASTRTPSGSIARPSTAQPTGDPAVALAELLTRTGRREEASTVWQAIARAGQAQRTGSAMGRAARAAQALGQVRLANSYFQTAANLSPDDPQVHTRWGDLFLEKFNEAEARSSYETALKADAQYVPALVGMARALADSNPLGRRGRSEAGDRHRSRSARRVGAAGLRGDGCQQACRCAGGAREGAGAQPAPRRGAGAVGGAGPDRGPARRRHALHPAGPRARRTQCRCAAHHRRACGPDVSLRRGRALPARGRGARSRKQPRPGLARACTCCAPATRPKHGRRSTPPSRGTRSTRSPTTC